MYTKFSENRKPKQKTLSALIHFICIAIIVFLPEVIMGIGDIHRSNLPMGVYVKSFLFIAVYYINYYFILDQNLNKKYSLYKIILYNIVLLIISIAILYIVWRFNAANTPIREYSAPHPMAPNSITDENAFIQPHDIRYTARTISLFIRDGIMIIMAMALSIAIKLSSKWKKAQEQKQLQIAAQREEELNSLKSQLNPHFLFNTLNSIYALIDISQSKAKKAVHELSHMLRYILYENNETVDLKLELKFVKEYIALMNLRLGNTIPVNVNIDIGNCDKIQIAPLIFITIIENAFKHGNTGNPSQPIEISITANDGYVACHTFNYFNEQKQTHNGIGLSNLQRRLALIYKQNAQLLIKQTDNTYTVDLHINLNQ